VTKFYSYCDHFNSAFMMYRIGQKWMLVLHFGFLWPVGH